LVLDSADCSIVDAFDSGEQRAQSPRCGTIRFLILPRVPGPISMILRGILGGFSRRKGAKRRGASESQGNPSETLPGFALAARNSKISRTELPLASPFAREPAEPVVPRRANVAAAVKLNGITSETFPLFEWISADRVPRPPGCVRLRRVRKRVGRGGGGGRGRGYSAALPLDITIFRALPL